MKKIIAVLILAGMSVYALAEYFEINTKLQCNDSEIIITAITDQYKEEPMWIGAISSTVKAMLFIHPTTYSWTYIVVGEKKACVINTGNGFSYRAPMSDKRDIRVDKKINI